MHLINAHLLSSAPEPVIIGTLGPLTPGEHANWFATLPEDLQQRTRIDWVPVAAVNVSPHLDETFGGWVVTCYDASGDVLLKRRFNDEATALDHASSITTIKESQS